MTKLRRTLLAAMTVIMALSMNGSVFAQTASPNAINPALEQSKGVYFYRDGVVNKCPADGGATFDAKEIKNIQGMYKSNLAQPYILEQFMIHILKRMAQISGKPESDLVTQEHVLGLVAFAIGEGGDIANRSLYNPMNGGMDPNWIGGTGSVWGGTGSDGRRGYASFDVGVELYARQFYTGYQTRIGAVLGDPSSTAQNFMYTLTYYNTYKGNKMWAEASLPPNDKKYYQERLKLVEQVRKNYPAYAGIVIGTDKLEQRAGIFNKELLTYKGSTSTTTTKTAVGTAAPTASSAEPDLSKITDVKESNKKNIPIIWSWLLGKGFTDVQAAGIMGNMYQEGKFEVTLDDPPAYGLIQWQGDRLTRLDSYAQKRGGTRADLDMQLRFMMAELNGGYKSKVLDPLKKATELADAVNIVLHEYEQPGNYDTEEPLRLKWAKEVFAAMKGVTSAPEPGAGCAPADDPQPADPTDGSFVFYSQNNPKWGDLPFNGGDIKGSGCGLTSFSMIVATLKKDKSITPKTMQQLVEKENVGFDDYVGVVLADKFKSRFNLNAKRLSASSESQIRNALKGGAYVISGGHEGPYQYDAHIIVLRSIDDKDNVSVADPEMDGLSKKTYKLSEFVGPGKYFVAIKNAQ